MIKFFCDKCGKQLAITPGNPAGERDPMLCVECWGKRPKPLQQCGNCLCNERLAEIDGQNLCCRCALQYVSRLFPPSPTPDPIVEAPQIE